MADTKKFGFITAASTILAHQSAEIAKDIQTELLHMGGECITENKITSDHTLFYFVLTGGTERIVLNMVEKRKLKFENEPVVLISHPGNNSLPASLEILARLQQIGSRGSIIFIDPENKECWNEIERTVKNFEIYHQLKKTKIGLIGKPSDWLVASTPDYGKLKKVWGPEVDEIEMNELIQEINEIKESEIEEAHYSFVNNATGIKEPTKKELKNVVKVYAALKKITKSHGLSAISVRCFDLVIDLKTTGCYALAKLNDDGIIAGCEGDLVSTIGMIWGNLFTNELIWMANPASIDEHNNSLWLAHCTIPLSIVDNYKLRSHFESGLGVGIQGNVSKGKSTLYRIGGSDLNKLWISNAEIIENGAEENLCRTQVHVKLHGNMKAHDLLNEPLGNHLLMLRGSFVKDMQNWFDIFIN